MSRIADPFAAAKALKAAATPFLAAYEAQDSEIPDSGLDDEQVKHVTVTLGDIRRLKRAMVWRG